MADYQAHLKHFERENIALLALSVDPIDKAREMVDQLQLTFPVGYGLQVPRDAERIGAFWEERRGIFHATNFLLGADGKVVHALYSTGPIGRISPGEALSITQFLRKRIVAGDALRLAQYLEELKQ